MNFARRQAVNFSFRVRDALKNGDGFLLHPSRKFAARNQLFNFRKIPLVIVCMIVVVMMFVMRMVVAVLVKLDSARTFVIVVLVVMLV